MPLEGKEKGGKIRENDVLNMKFLGYAWKIRARMVYMPLLAGV